MWEERVTFAGPRIRRPCVRNDGTYSILTINGLETRLAKVEYNSFVGRICDEIRAQTAPLKLQQVLRKWDELASIVLPVLLAQEHISESGNLYTTKMHPRILRIYKRVEEMGRLGSKLIGEINLTDVVERTMEDDFQVLQRYERPGEELKGAAFSMLCMDFPVQMRGNDSLVEKLYDLTFEHVILPTDRIDMSDREWRKQFFPLKQNPAASNKVNVYLDEVYQSLTLIAPDHRNWLNPVLALLAGKASDDQAAGVILAGFGLCRMFGADISYRMAAQMLLDPKGCKSLTLAIKGLGQNGTLCGAMLCEGGVLQGRGVPADDFDEDRKYRTDVRKVSEKMHSVNKDALREAIKYVLKLELPNEVIFENSDEHWTKRWLWCVNGSHSRTIERLNPQYTIADETLKGSRLHRKVFAENMTKNPIDDWNGKSYFAQSAKLEGGKTRCIYAGDSLTYFAFEELLTSVERSWFNRRIILDPGAIGTYGMARRLKRLKRFGSVNIMLDYDDYNARHRNEYMAMVFEELIIHTGYDQERGAKLMASFYKSYMWNPETKEHDLIAGTLMSGHRATTFINSVLNYAYIEAVCPDVREMKSMHVGDDVYILSDSYSRAFSLLTACKNGGLAMNPLKQSVGTYTAEFLRVAYKRDHCIGYLMRSVFSTVAGNWVSELKLSYKEGLNTILSAAWTLKNRSAGVDVGLLLYKSLRRMAKIGDRLAYHLLEGSYVNGISPARYENRDTNRVVIDYPENEITRRVDEAIRYCQNSATTDYISYHATPVEQYAMTYAKQDVFTTMKRSSYMKSIRPKVEDETVDDGKPKVKETRFSVRGFLTADEAWEKTSPVGVCSSMPILVMMRNALDQDKKLLQDIVNQLTDNWYEGDLLNEVAWGVNGGGCAVAGFLSYSDASKISCKLNGEMIRVYYQCYV